jgi:hypothetical protein
MHSIDALRQLTDQDAISIVVPLPAGFVGDACSGIPIAATNGKPAHSVVCCGAVDLT